jgi:hypothetical protein
MLVATVVRGDLPSEGAVSRVAEVGTTFGNRQVSHAITLDAVWRPGEDFGDRDTAWTRGFFAALGRFREGVYVNFLGRCRTESPCALHSPRFTTLEPPETASWAL